MGARLPFSSVLSPKGFTLLELLIVLAIVIILFILIIARFTLFARQVNLESAAQEIINTLQLARNQTSASEGESTWGVHFETNKFTVFKGTDFLSGTDKDEYSLDGVEIYIINIADGGSDVVFNRVRGGTTDTGTIAIRLTSDSSRTKTIVINSLGGVSLQESINPLDSRIADTRHIHFDNCSSIQNSAIMRLIFTDPPNPTVQHDIAIQGYLNAGKDDFNWEDEVNVNGSIQELHIQTHLLNATESEFSITRDRRKNDKALQIQVDGTALVTYSAGGVATNGIFCGLMNVQ